MKERLIDYRAADYLTTWPARWGYLVACWQEGGARLAWRALRDVWESL